MDPKKQNLLLYSSNVARQQYWSSEKICELKVSLSKFLDSSFKVKVSEAVAQRCPVKKVLWKILQNSLKNIHDAVVNLIKLHAKSQ